MKKNLRLVDVNGDFQDKFGVSVETSIDHILNANVLNADESVELIKPNIARLQDNKHTLLGADFSKLNMWDCGSIRDSTRYTFCECFGLIPIYLFMTCRH